MDKKLFDSELKIMQLIWQNEPVSAKKVSLLADDAFGWNKNTTYTVLKKLCERGFFKNEGGEVKVLITREEYYSRKSEMFVQESFEGSLPAFIAAFTSRRKLSESEIAEIRKMIDGGK